MCTVGPPLVCISVLQAFIVDIFSSKDDKFLGRSSILPQHLKDDAGRLTLTVFNKEMLPVGVIQCELKDIAQLWPIQAHMFLRKSALGYSPLLSPQLTHVRILPHRQLVSNISPHSGLLNLTIIALRHDFTARCM